MTWQPASSRSMGSYRYSHRPTRFSRLSQGVQSVPGRAYPTSFRVPLSQTRIHTCIECLRCRGKPKGMYCKECVLGDSRDYFGRSIRARGTTEPRTGPGRSAGRTRQGLQQWIASLSRKGRAYDWECQRHHMRSVRPRLTFMRSGLIHDPMPTLLTPDLLGTPHRCLCAAILISQQRSSELNTLDASRWLNEKGR